MNQTDNRIREECSVDYNLSPQITEVEEFSASVKLHDEWEYSEYNNLSTEKRLDFFNKIGKLGWELCLVRGGNNYIFKRKIYGRP